MTVAVSKLVIKILKGSITASLVLDISNLTKAVLCNVHNMSNTQLSGMITYEG